MPGVDGTIDTAAADSDGNLDVGGQFSVAGSVIANNVAKWNGSAWSALGSGVSGSEDWIANHVNVSAFAFATNGNLYAAGYFSTAGGVPATNIAQWDGRIRLALGSGIGDSNAWVNVDALACDDSGNLYAGGRFTTAGGVSATNIAQWNGSAWLALGSGIGDTNANVFALTCDSSGNLYAGGDFTSAGDVSATNIAEWNGSSWLALGSGVSGAVFAPGRLGYTGPEVSSLAVVGDKLYVGGIFTLAGGVSVNNVARWDGSSWTALGAGLGTEVRSLVVSGTNLCAGAATWSDITGWYFDIARWNGNSWVELGSGSYIPGSILAVSGTNVFVGGGSTISEWNGTTWLALGKGWDDGRIYALAASDTSLYVGGWFTTTAGGGPANYIAQWNGSSWLALGSGISGVGMNPPVAALAVSGTNLFVGGNFTIAGGCRPTTLPGGTGVPGQRWGRGFRPSTSLKLTFTLSRYAAATCMREAVSLKWGGLSANNIAQWNGNSWSALGSGINGRVSALAVSGSDLYVGGAFDMAGNVPAANVAKWNGSTWSALRSGMNGAVTALAVSPTKLYVAGNFTTPSPNIAEWNGSFWLALRLGGGRSCKRFGGIGRQPVCWRSIQHRWRDTCQFHC